MLESVATLRMPSSLPGSSTSVPGFAKFNIKSTDQLQVVRAFFLWAKGLISA